MHIAIVIPALNEEGSIAQVVRGMTAEAERLNHRVEIWVADNGSTDRTAQRASAAGARVVLEPRTGYGAACLKVLRELAHDVEVVVFADGDDADDPGDLEALLSPIVNEQVDLVLGSRALGEKLGWVEAGSLSDAQRFGNLLSTWLVRLLFGYSYTDLGPFRAISIASMARLRMNDPNYGWTLQMQTRAALAQLKVREVPVHYRKRRLGQSKVSGSILGSIKAGSVILKTVFKERALGRSSHYP